MVRCSTCGVPIFDSSEPHTSPLLWSANEDTRIHKLWDTCPWPHPQELRDSAGELISETQPLFFTNGEPAPGPGIIVFKKDIEYPDKHPYWTWVHDYHQLRDVFRCPGPKISEACATWIGDSEGPKTHATCDEECYCHCHSESCICPDPDLGVDPKALAIVCSIHGHVYTKITAQGL